MARNATKKEAAVAARPASEVAPASSSYGDEAGAGFEDVNRDELLMPFLAVLQGLSKPITEGTVAGARPGMIINTVTNELFSGEDGVVIQPVALEHVYVEWVPRSKGGGFCGRHDLGSELVKTALQRHIEVHGGRFAKDAEDKLIPVTIETEEGVHELVETYYVYCQILDDDGKEAIGFAVVAFTSKKIKPLRAWTTTMYTMRGRPPIFAHRARITTAKEQNEKGTFFNIRINPLVVGSWKDSLIDPTSEEGKILLAGGRQLREMITSGAARANFDSQDAAGGDGASGEDLPF